jgi:GntR family transcriptional regulator
LTYIEVNITSPVPVYQQIMDQLRRLVSDGNLAPGAPLPSVRQLACELAVNPNTVAKAYQFLELEGTIVTLKRRGAFVGESSSAKAALARDRRLEEVVDRLAEDAARLGLNGEEIIEAFAEKLRQREGREEATGRKKAGEETASGENNR